MGENAQAQKSIWEVLIEKIGQAQTIYSVIAFVCVILVFVACLILFRRNVNKLSKQQINVFKDNKKYIPQLYVELNNNMEKLRYFFFSTRWKERIIKEYNLLFRGHVGKKFKIVFKREINYHICCFSTINQIEKTLIQTRDVLENYKQNHKDKEEQLGDLVHFVSSITYSCVRVISELLDNVTKIKSKNLMLIGSAGNGKTNLLCRATELLIKNKYPCLLINSRDVDETVKEHIIKTLPLFWKSKNHPTWFLFIVNILLRLRNKYFFIIIDAINENDNEKFRSSIGEVCEYFEKYSRVKVLMSCRSEYFECRYQKYFDKAKILPNKYELATNDYDEAAIRRFFILYSDYFNVPKNFSYNVRLRLAQSLLLMRIFFEVNSGKDLDHLEFQNAEIYLKYIEKLGLQHPNVNLKRIIESIAYNMISSGCYDKVDIDKITLSNIEKNEFFSVLDNNLLISKTVKNGIGISERVNEFLYFVFDEFRDFCLARYLIIKSEDSDDNEYSNYFEILQKLQQEHASPLEGMLKYGYYHFGLVGQHCLREKLLKEYGNSKPRIWSRDNYSKPKNFFSDFGLTLIFLDGRSLEPYEKEYIKTLFERDNAVRIQLLFFLFNDEITGGNLGLSTFNSFLLDCEEQVYLDLFNELVKRDPYEDDDERYINSLYDRLEYLLKLEAELPKAIKYFFIMLFAYYPEERYNFNSDVLELEEGLYDEIAIMAKNEQVKSTILELRDRDYHFHEQINSSIDVLQYIREFMKENNIIDEE